MGKFAPGTQNNYISTRVSLKGAGAQRQRLNAPWCLARASSVRLDLAPSGPQPVGQEACAPGLALAHRRSPPRAAFVRFQILNENQYPVL